MALLTALLMALACQPDQRTEQIPPVAAEVYPAPETYTRVVSVANLTAYIVFEREWSGDVQQLAAEAFAEGLAEQGFATDLSERVGESGVRTGYDFYVFVARAFADAEGSPVFETLRRHPGLRSTPVAIVVIGEATDPTTLSTLTQVAEHRGAIVTDAITVACPRRVSEAEGEGCDLELILNEMYHLGYCTGAFWDQQ